MKIAVLAWGSLIWDRRNLAIAADFKPNGPPLPLEFSRVSGGDRLTLVIDEAHGTACTTYSAQSAHTELDVAMENLRIRENMPGRKGIGFVSLVSHRQSDLAADRHPLAVQTIKSWTKANLYDATIWTALASNFHEKAKEPFSIETATRFLETRSAASFEAALAYIRRAPLQIQTPVRKAIHERWPE